MDFRLETQAQDYARVLRAIGQDLAELLPELLEIEAVGQDYIARGTGKPTRTEEVADNNEGGLRKTWNRLVGRTQEAEPTAAAPPSTIQFELEYSPADIDRIDEAGIAHRRNTASLPDIYGLAERLRTIGRIVNSHKGQFIRLTKNTNSVAFQYRDDQGQVRSEEYSTFALYKIQQAYYGERGTFKPADIWRGFDR